jgi:hypothetical protein
MKHADENLKPRPPAASSTTVEDWIVTGIDREASISSGGSVAEIVVKEVMGSLERGDSVRVSSMPAGLERARGFHATPGFEEPASVQPRREMVFMPSAGSRQKPAGSISQQDGIYDVARLEGSRAHIVLVPKDDPLGNTVSRVVERVPEIVRARRQELSEKNIEALVELYLADDPIAEARLAIETDNARERARFLSEVTCLTSKQIAENAGHRATNSSVTGSRWKQQGKLFSVPSRGIELYPAFQFRDGQPHPAIAKILRELPKPMSPWQIAFWFTSSNGWLSGAAPADRLDEEPAVVKAAQRESEPIIG